MQVVDGIQGTVAGALRGCGRQNTVMGTNFLGFWARIVFTTAAPALALQNTQYYVCCSLKYGF